MSQLNYLWWKFLILFIIKLIFHWIWIEWLLPLRFYTGNIILIMKRAYGMRYHPIFCTWSCIVERLETNCHHHRKSPFVQVSFCHDGKFSTLLLTPHFLWHHSLSIILPFRIGVKFILLWLWEGAGDGEDCCLSVVWWGGWCINIAVAIEVKWH